ncbi:hypothetical protein FITA111629_11355 [Filibacter tadaridae]|uniref:Uncharacterized protein n=1 Tax=Filibacter tadaridae TaxID=2483811 RepID=A0A3P5WU06_9BACL|nr:hypothetical protein FILTAD_01197 [Filibacter tadaridae]
MFGRVFRFFDMLRKIKKWFDRNGVLLLVAILFLGILILSSL